MKIMKIKGFISSLLLIAVSVSLHAETICPDEALTIATSFAQWASLASGRRGVKDLSASVEQVYASDGCYIFNRGLDEGFVVVAADDAARSTVLGYSLTGHFDPDDIPDGMQWWLRQYDEQVALAAAAEKMTTATASTLSTQGSVVVEPLLRTAWEQGEPFNLLCTEPKEVIPDLEGSVPCGCLATAMAQIMKFYEWPAYGTGQKTYTYTYPGTTTDITVSADFSQSAYDWEHMRDNYGYKGYEYYYTDDGVLHYYSSRPLNVTEEEKMAVARLIKDVGVACEMAYKIGGSGASTSAAARAFYTYFDYERSLVYRRRSNYTDRRWDGLLREELNNGRPVLYTGTRANGVGHAFVCDGYTSDGYFHFNWGWKGKSDGYFLTTALNPDNSGTGEAEGGYGYSQSIITGIQPNWDGIVSNEPTSLELSFSGLTSTDAKKFSFTTHISLLEGEVLKYYLFFQNLTKGNKYYKAIKTVSIPHDGLWSSTVEAFQYIPAIDDGLYLVYPTYSREGADDTRIRMQPDDTDIPALLVSIDGSKRSVIAQAVVNGVRLCPTADGKAMLLPDRYEGSVEVPATVTIEDTELPVTEVAYGAFADSYALDDITLHRNMNLSKAKVPDETAVTLDIVDGDRIDWTDNAASYDRIRYTRRFADYGTLVLPFDVSAEALAEAGLKVYALSESGLTFDEAESIVAGTPYFYVDETYDGQDIAKTLEAADVTVDATMTAGMTESDGWRMTGTFNKFYETGDWGDEPPYYGLGNDYQLKGATRSITVWPYRAYFTIKDGAASQAITLRSNDGSTSVISLSGSDGSANANANADDVYDLQGRKVTNPSAGLYIVNGKKVFLQ